MSLADMRNLGEKSAAQLAAVGICTEEDLRNGNLLAIYLDLKSTFPQTNLVFLWALWGTLNDCDYRNIPPEVKEKLKAELQKRQSPQLEDLPNIAKKMAENLRAVGILTPADLERLGVEQTWILLRKKFPQSDICACVLYTLHGALSGEKWYEISAQQKAYYKDFSARWRAAQR
jgi:DNA transformation protein